MSQRYVIPRVYNLVQSRNTRTLFPGTRLVQSAFTLSLNSTNVTLPRLWGNSPSHVVLVAVTFFVQVCVDSMMHNLETGIGPLPVEKVRFSVSSLLGK